MNAIVSVTSDWGIGCDGGLIVPNREDMRRFVRLTSGGTVLMGRVTFESFPHGPLKNRRNVVVTRQAGYGDTHPGIECAATLEKALELVGSDDPQSVWLIGGARLYAALLKDCTRCYVTRNQISTPADAYFPNLDDDTAWELECIEGSGVTEAGVPYDFAVYRRLAG